ncbi:MAG TPA: cupin domain-containing protein [Pyrinomonadaceae bacterium]
MRRHIFAYPLVLLAACAIFAQAGRERAAEIAPAMHVAPAEHVAGHSFHVALQPETIQWKPFYEGAEIAVLEGDPAAAGSHYVIRIKHRDGLKVPPHWHPFDEHLTVITGTWVMGMGEKYDLTGAQEFGAGAYLVSPKNVPHYALSKGETIVQVHGTGPFQAVFVNPEDDVFKKK